MSKRTSRGIGLTSLALGLAVLLLAHWPAPAAAQSTHVSVLKIDGAIDPISARYLSRAIGKATDDGAVLVVLELDTPGGRLDSTRDMVESILGARIPLAVYVSPSGAQAASAGTFITAAANFAVMAPATNIGAASPISASGEDLPETLARKVNEDTKAFIRGIAEERDRNAEALQDTVTSALSYSATEAVELRVVDLIATDITDLLNQLDGRTAQTAAGPVVLSTAGVPTQQIKKTLVESFLTVIADPNIAFLLLSIGSLSLMAEFFSPGVFGPGIVGVLALALAWVSLGVLPVNWVAVALILFSFGLFYFEMQVPGVGVFGAGGLVTFVVGAFLLFGGWFESSQIPEPTVEVNRWLIAATTALAAVALLSLFALLREGGSTHAYTTASDRALVGERGVAVTDLAPSGTVRIGDREWSATMKEGEQVSIGGDVRVVAVYSGGVLKVSGSSANPGSRS
ncbi:MAG: nodulation protein NfeD [Dehalococcoidia bacterium]|jgi:membrane-bound serine protease (ClpP class)|nr:nodulation protein NfeD [Dehalococcoidia bacterium]